MGRGGHRCRQGQVMKDLRCCDLKFRFNPVEKLGLYSEENCQRVLHCREMGLDLSWKHTTACGGRVVCRRERAREGRIKT